MEKTYTTQSTKLLRYFNWINKILKSYYIADFGEEIADEILEKSPVEFEALIPLLPDVGGKDNLFTPVLIASGGMLAIARVLETRNINAKEMFIVFSKAIDKLYNFLPKFIMRILGRLFLSKFGGVRILRKQAARSQERKYPADWVFEVVEGDGEEFDWMIEYYECAVIKFWEGQEAYDLMACCNFGDMAMSKALGLGMESATLGEGCETCVAKLKYGRETETPAWISA